MRFPRLHPFLFSAYFVLYSLSVNTEQSAISAFIRPLIFVLLITGIIYAVFYYFAKQLSRAGLLTSLSIILVLYYGHFYGTIVQFPPTEFLAKHRLIVFLLWALLLSPFAGRWIYNRYRIEKVVDRFLTIVAIAILIIPILLVFISIRESRAPKPDPVSTGSNNSPANVQARIDQSFRNAVNPNQELPDIYYIILDGYGRADVLQEIFEFDNSDFVQGLERRGFYIADKSRSNYIETHLSLASTLNLTHAKDLRSNDGKQPRLGQYLSKIRNSEVRSILRNLGYEIVTVENGYTNIFWNDTDIFFTPYDKKLPIQDNEWLLISTSALGIPIELLHLGNLLPIPGYDSHRTRIQYALDKLEEIPANEGPKFVFVHILAPHPPFVINRNGEGTRSYRPFYGGDGSVYRGTAEEYREGYIEELLYLNARIEKAIDKILANSEKNPIIIIQGDHGPGLLLDWASEDQSCHWERTGILNAYYLPQKSNTLYSAITPVNSFRLVLNELFEANLELLEDRSYFTNSKPPEFIDITEKIDNKDNCFVN